MLLGAVANPGSADEILLGLPSATEVLEISIEPLQEPLIVGESFQPLITALLSDGRSQPVDPTDDDVEISIAGDEGIISVSASGEIVGLARGAALVRVIHWGRHLVGASALLQVEVRPADDLDNDGLPDSYELLHGFDPAVPGDGEADIDLDGLSGSQELALGTDPKEGDTDGDGRSDLEELFDGTDPLTPDSDSAPEPSLRPGCKVVALNRVVPVAEDGTWILNDVPASFGPIRLRASCETENGAQVGESELISVPENGVVEVAEFTFGATTPIPVRLTLSLGSTTLTEPGQQLTLTVEGTLGDGTLLDLSGSEVGTGYRSTNPSIAEVSSEGVVTARGSGTAILSAIYEGVAGFLQVAVILSGDSDGDGLPDDFEIANGLDPNDPSDGFLDSDGDGLSNTDEFQLGLDPFNPDTDADGLSDGEEVTARGTSPLLFDTDGDGLGDGLEVQTGSDPLDPSSFNLEAAVSSLAVEPAAFTIVFNTVFGEASREVRVLGELIDGNSLDLTAPSYGTAFASSDLAVASFGLEPGRVFAGTDGQAVVTASVAGFEATTVVTVETVGPQALSALRLPGFPNSVAVQGGYAYVASGSAGLLVVDVSDLEAPVLAARLGIAGNANDLRVQGSFAYVAAGTGDVAVVDLSDPVAPQLVAVAAPTFSAIDLAVRGDRLYVADSLGLAIFDVLDPASPVLLGRVDLPGVCRGVAVEGTTAVVTAYRSGVHVIDVADPATPVRLGTVHTRGTESFAADVALRDGLAYVADGATDPEYSFGGPLGGLKVVDISQPDTPAVVGETTVTLGLVNVALERGFAFGADYFFANGVPILGLGGASLPLGTELDFSGAPSFRDDNGNGIAVRNGAVFLVGARPVKVDNGRTGDGALHIGRYARLADEEGVPPRVELLSPAEDTLALERTRLLIEAAVTDDVQMDAVRFLVDGEVATTDYDPPYLHAFRVPEGVSGFTVQAVATDLGGNEGSTEEVFVTVAPNLLPVAELLSPGEGLRYYEGGTLPIVALASDDDAVASVELFVDGGPVASLTEPPFRFDFPIPLGTSQLEVSAVATDSVGQQATASRTVPVEPDPAPVVTILDPASGPVHEGTDVSVVVAAADNEPLASVELLADGVPLPPLAAPPYSFDVDVPLGATELRLQAFAEDTLGQRSATAELVLGVTGDPPSVRILTPPAGGLLVSGQEISLSAAVADDAGLAEVLFLVNGEAVASFASAPFEAAFTVPGGISDLVFEALAIDTLGLAAQAGRAYRVVEDGPPTVELLSPAEGSTLVEGSTIVLAADAFDLSAVASVTFAIDGVAGAPILTPPYEEAFTVPTGVSSVSIEALAEDDSGQTASDGGSFPVVANQPPLLGLLTPAEGAILVAGGTAPVLAAASDDVGVANVAFTVPDYFAPGDDLVEVDTTSPYGFNLGIPAGVTSLALQVTATDLLGAQTSLSRTWDVEGDAPTRVVARIVDLAGNPVPGAVVMLVNDLGGGFADAAGEAAIEGVTTGQGDIQAIVTAADGDGYLLGASAELPPVGGGTTDLGTVVVAPPAEVAFYDLCEDTFRPERASSFDAGVPCSETFPTPEDVVAAVVSTTPTDVLLHFEFGEPVGPELVSALVSLDLDEDPATGARSRIDAVSPYAETGLGADLEVLIVTGETEDGVELVFGTSSLTLVLPLDLIGDARLRFAAVFFGYGFGTGGGGDPQIRSIITDRASEDPPGLEVLSAATFDNLRDVDVLPNGGFYSVPSPADLDGDGLGDGDEVLAGTDPLSADTDGDSLLDSFEILYGLDPRLDDGADRQDPDGDGLDTREEAVLGTDPFSTDTDLDGLEDRTELFTHGTRPTRLDSDGDGLRDDEELASLGTDPALPDTDRDGLHDGTETSSPGLLPASFDTDGGGASDGQESLLDGTDPLEPSDDLPITYVGDPAALALEPAVAVDAAGNAHVAWVQGSFGNRGVYYAMIAPTGALLIADTHVGTTFSASQPQIAVDSLDRIHLAWLGIENLDATEEIFHTLLDPSLDDQDGSPADPAVISVAEDQQVSAGGGISAREPRLGLDEADRAHLVWVDSFAGEELHHARLTTAGAIDITDHLLVEGLSDLQTDLAVGSDGAGGLHVLWADESLTSFSRPLFYALVDADAGALEIDATELLAGVEPHEYVEPSILSLAAGQVTVLVQRDLFVRSASELLRLDVDPSGDDRDGDPADPADILVSTSRVLETLFDAELLAPRAGVDGDGSILLAYLGIPPNADAEVYLVRTGEGSPAQPPLLVSDLGASNFDRPALGTGQVAGYVAWVSGSEDRIGVRRVYLVVSP